jgi:lactoylglutathione lyase
MRHQPNLGVGPRALVNAEARFSELRVAPKLWLYEPHLKNIHRERRMTAAVRLNHMSVLVRSLPASVKFYQEILLLPEIECGARLPHIRWFGLGDGQSVHLIEGEIGNTLVKRSTHFCISSDDFDGTIRHLRDKNVNFCNAAGEEGKIHIRADGVRSVYFQDPDGYWIEVNEDF